jgi:polysaccharide chain length determinant protein (PEP-CTERM system associated)
MAKTHTLPEMAGAIVRRRWLILVPFAIGVAMAPYLAKYAPPRYRSEALIVVIPQQVPDDYVKSAVSQTLDQRLPGITDQILSRTKLQPIIEDLDLYRRERARMVMEDVVDRMRSDVSTSAVAKNLDSFRISYVSDDAKKAQQVTERLVTLYINQDQTDREDHAEHTSAFLQTAVADAKGRMLEQERKVLDYKRSHTGEMPEQMQGNLQAIQSATFQLQALNESINHAQAERLFMGRQLADAEALPETSIPVPGAAPVELGVPLTTGQELELKKARRAVLLQRFTPQLPEIIRLDQEIAELAERLAREAPVSSASARDNAPVTPAEAAQRRKISDLKGALARLDYQLEANGKEVTRLQKVIATYQAKVDAVPTRDAELVELNRDYSTLKATYESLRMKSEDSTLAANLERQKISEQFKLVDQASMPERPYNQRQRRLTMVSGAIAGLVLGLLVVGLLEFTDSSFRRSEDVVQTLSVPVLASIPVMRSERERRTKTLRSRAMDIGGAALLVTAMMVLVLWRP